MREADGGGVILIDPESLRRCATTVDNVASDYTGYASLLGGLGLPVMPAPVAGRVVGGIAEVSSTLQAMSGLHEDAVELRSRALWTEVADAIACGYPLTGSQLRQFVAGLENGSLVRYAEPWQAQLAGEWVGTTYAKTFKEPAKLRELAKILAGSGRDGDFAIGFVQRFGAKNLVEVPRVLQAMRWTNAVADPMGLVDPHSDSRLALELQRDGYRQGSDDPLKLLASFAMVLAVSTSTADRRSPNPLAAEEDAIASSPDSWAVAQLLNGNNVYGRRFLVGVFRKQLIPAVQRDTTDYVAGGFPQTTLPLGDNVPTDAKEIILHALARNPAAAADALSHPLSEPVRFVTPYGPVESADPIEVLYRGYWHDHGQAFANVYTAATDHLQQLAARPQLPDAGYHPTVEQRQALHDANELTKSLIEQTLHAPDRVDVMTSALASDVAAHHVGDLYVSARQANPGDWIDVNPDQNESLIMTVRTERDLLSVFAGDPQLDHRVMSAAAAYQGQLIREHTIATPTDTNMRPWTTELGSFNAVALSAHDMHLQQQFDASNERHRAMFGFAQAVAKVVTAPADAIPGFGAARDLALDTIDHATEPSPDLLAAQKGDQYGLVTNSLNGAIAAGYYHNHPEIPSPAGHLSDSGTRTLLGYGSLRDHDQISDYNDWVNSNGEAGRYTTEPFQEVGRTMSHVLGVIGS